MIAQRVIVDHLYLVGGVAKVQMTKELLQSAHFARQRYNLYLEEEEKKREQTRQTQKQRVMQDEVDQHKRESSFRQT